MRLAPSLLAIAVVQLVACPWAAAERFSGYEIRSALAFHFPQESDPALRGPTVFENLADGRILALSTLLPSPTALDGTPQLFVESAVGSRQFQFLGDLPLAPGGAWPSYGGAFLEVSPDGSRVAVGDNGLGTQRVGVFDVDDLLLQGSGVAVDWYSAPHFTAAWLDDRHLALTHSIDATTSGVSVLDADSAVTSPDIRAVLVGLGGASSSVALDAADRLYAGNGFDYLPGGSNTGTFRRFEASEWRAALEGNPPLAFESAGEEVGEILSAGSLEVDLEGNLLIGGADYFGGGDADYLAVLQGAEVGGAIRSFDPNGEYDSSYVLVYNEVTGEIYANEPFALNFGDPIDNTLVHVIAPPRPGDATGEGLVDGADFTIWSDGFGQFNGDAAISDGDFNGDGFVDGADFTIWSDQFDPGEGAVTPEPRSAVLGLMAVLAAASGWLLPRVRPLRGPTAARPTAEARACRRIRP